jgi:basic amino acid/polyamine antiporter, APA family
MVPLDGCSHNRYRPAAMTTLARKLGPFDATMIVMGGIIGAGIFMNPAVVARAVTSPGLIIGAWVAGGAIALIGAFVYAELAALKPEVGGQYAYLRDAFHPSVAFLYGWALLLVTQTGGMAAVSVTFARYLLELTAIGIPEKGIAVGTLLVLAVINCFGVRAGSNVQSALMMAKIAALLMLVAVGFAVGSPTAPASAPPPALTEASALTAFAAAMIPVLFAYGGWQTASFVSGELRDPRRDLPRGLVLGVCGVVILYVAVNVVCVRVLGVGGLAASGAPASDVMRVALGEQGARLIALGIAVSTVGFLSQSVLTAPRVYYAMAKDGLFFQRVGWLDPRSRVPVVAILVQAVWASVIAVSGRYEQILNYVVSIDVVFFGLTGVALLVLRRKAGAVRADSSGRRVHPLFTVLFVAAMWTVAVTTIVKHPGQAGIGVLILLLGVPALLWWRRSAASR